MQWWHGCVSHHRGPGSFVGGAKGEEQTTDGPVDQSKYALVLGRVVIFLVASGLVPSWVLDKHVKSVDMVAAHVGACKTRNL
jgi:hypothetical protein